MDVKDMLIEGDYAMVAPIGLPIQLVYDTNGVLFKITPWPVQCEGFLDVPEFSKEFQSLLRSLYSIPYNVNTRGGSTYVYCIIEHSIFGMKSSGHLPGCFAEEIKSKLISGNSFTRLHALTVLSNATSLHGHSNISRWLTINGFHTVAGMFVTQDKDYFYQTVKAQCEGSVATDIIFGYVVISYDNSYFVPNGLTSGEVKNEISPHYNEHGAIMSDVIIGDTVHHLPYYNVYEHGLCKGAIVIMNEDSIVRVVTYPHSVKGDSRKLVCEVCGCPIPLTATRLTACKDPNCLSNSYPRVVNMLEEFKLPILEFSEYRELVSSHKIEDILDILECLNYSVEVSLTTLLKAVMTGVPKQLISIFVDQCKNSVEAVIHYMNHPDRIAGDLVFGYLDPYYLVDWFASGANALLLQSSLDFPRIQIVDTDKYFEASAILKGNTICITGEFSIGTHDDVKGIIRSYSGNVSEDVLPETNYIVTGDRQLNVDSRIVAAGRANSIPIISESEFFNHYDILKDLKDHNLL